MRPTSTSPRTSKGAAIEAAGARMLFLPPYSPDFKPIGMAFSKLKAPLRKAAERTVEGQWSAIGRLADTVTPDECANFFTAAGYEPDYRVPHKTPAPGRFLLQDQRCSGIFVRDTKPKPP